jgi:hypothetical protein
VKMLNLTRSLAVLTVALATSTLSAQQPSPTDIWTIESSYDYDDLEAKDELQLKRRSDGLFDLDVKGTWWHDLQDGDYKADPKDREKMLMHFANALDIKGCPNSTDRDWFYSDIVDISGHKHSNEPKHDHLVVLFRACIADKGDECAHTHFVLLLLDGKTSLMSADTVVKALSHNGLIHGPQ